MNIESKDVFISYRRKDGATVARLLFDTLERRGISAFFDRESIESGNFEDALRNSLLAVKNVLVVVSAEMFNRGKLSDGNYDPALVAADWVYEEIRLALDYKKNIIPIFVNGVSDFPDQLPAPIKFLAKENTITLSHEHFDAQLNELIGRLVTKKHMLLEAFLKVNEETYGDTLETLLRTCESLSGDKIEISDALARIIRKNWDKLNLSAERAVDELTEGFGIFALKDLCKALDLDNTGATRRMKDNITNWLQGGECRPFILAPSERDRLDKLIDALAESFRSHVDRQAITLAIEDEFGINLRGSKKSSDDVFRAVFDDYDVEDFFERMNKHISQDQIKYVCKFLFDGEDKGHKKTLVNQIISYVNYEYNFESVD